MDCTTRQRPAVMRGATSTMATSALLVAASMANAGTLPPQPTMGEPLDGLNATELDQFTQGKFQFERVLTVSDGLGPIFNRESCVACHISPTGGAGTQTVVRFAAYDGMTYDDLFLVGGPVLHLSSTTVECGESIPAAANVFTERITPSGIGSGLIESILDADIVANADVADVDADGISGRATISFPFENPVARTGRFGWKAGFATLNSFSADAARNESGLTNIFLPFENDPNGFDPPTLSSPDNCDTVADPEDILDGDGFYYFERAAQFLRFTAPPPQTPRSGHPGEDIFNSVGCDKCHAPQFVTSTDLSVSESLRGITIRPYSDFLLHDMGSTGDPMIEGDAGIGEVRTPALWGIRARDPLWHDGSATGSTFEDRVLAAINKHNAAGSEAANVYTDFAALDPGDQTALVQFLATLGQREFDFDGDNLVNLSDYTDFRACMGGGPYAPDDPCAIHDVDQDGDVDALDFETFLLAYNGVLVDCNANGTPDLGDIVFGNSTDQNDNHIPDECDCAADCTPDNGDGTYGNGLVNIDDLLSVINAFGATGDNRCDIAPMFVDGTFGNDLVNIDDVLTVINEFGPCFKTK